MVNGALISNASLTRAWPATANRVRISGCVALCLELAGVIRLLYEVPADKLLGRWAERQAVDRGADDLNERHAVGDRRPKLVTFLEGVIHNPFVQQILLQFGLIS